VFTYTSPYMLTARKPDCFRALADPTRRAVFSLLVRRELSVSDLARRFTISQPAVSQHYGGSTIRPPGA
jgi:DNA-binding transcriptional ArsR family regulator